MYIKLFLITLIVFVSLFVVEQSFSAIDGLVGAWLFDKDSGNKTIDSSGKGHDGEIVGNAKLDKNGKYGSAIICDGTEGYVMIPDHTDFEFDGDFSIACWVQNEVPPNDPSSFVTKGYHRPAASGGDAKPWYLVYYLKAGTVDLYLRDKAGVNSRAVGKTAINDGKWHHVVSMKDGNKVKVFIDGKEDGSADAVNAKYGDNDQPLVFMVHYDRWFKGMIDEVAIFNKALNEAQISAIMKGLSQNVLAVNSKDKLAGTWGDLKLR